MRNVSVLKRILCSPHAGWFREGSNSAATLLSSDERNQMHLFPLRKTAWRLRTLKKAYTAG